MHATSACVPVPKAGPTLGAKVDKEQMAAADGVENLQFPHSLNPFSYHSRASNCKNSMCVWQRQLRAGVQRMQVKKKEKKKHLFGGADTVCEWGLQMMTTKPLCQVSDWNKSVYVGLCMCGSGRYISTVEIQGKSNSWKPNS